MKLGDILTAAVVMAAALWLALSLGEAARKSAHDAKCAEACAMPLDALNRVQSP